MGISGSCGCHNQVPPTGGLETAETYSSGDQVSKVKVSAGSAPPGGSGEDPLLLSPLLVLPAIFGVPWLIDV